MATEKLIVKNFGPIREAELDLKKVTVFIGEQASGKSVLAKLITILKTNVKIQNTEFFFDQLKHFEIDTFVNNGTIINCKIDNLIFEFRNLVFEVYKTQSHDVKMSELSSLLESLNSEIQDINDVDFKDEIRKNFKTKLEQSRKLINSLSKDSFYIPTERFLISTISNSLFGLTLNNIILPKYLLAFGQLFEAARKEIKDFKTSVLKNLSYNYQEGKNIIEFNESEVELSKSSSGIQSIIPLLLCIDYVNTKILGHRAGRFVVEEPELNLFPSTQKKLVEYLIEKSTKSDNRLIITTHSPYILTALNNLIQAKNVVKKSPELADEVAKIVPPQYHLDFDDIAVYFVGDGTAHSILNIENQLIDASALDAISEEIGEDFGKLIQLEFQNEPA